MMNSTSNWIGKEFKFISDALHELKRWENMPSRRELVPTKMIEFIEFIETNGKRIKTRIIYTHQ